MNENAANFFQVTPQPDWDRPTRECAACRRQTSVTAGTILHRSHLPLKTCFHAAYDVATRSNGIPALQVQGQPGIGSNKTAWLLLQNRRPAMVDPGRGLLQTPGPPPAATSSINAPDL